LAARRQTRRLRGQNKMLSNQHRKIAAMIYRFSFHKEGEKCVRD